MKLHAIASFVLLGCPLLTAQNTASVHADPPALQTSSSLVIVPTMVRSAFGEFVPGLAVKDFKLTDNGVEQRVQLDADPNQRLAIVVVMQTGAGAPKYFQNYRTVANVLSTISTSPSLKAALVTFDSRPEQIWNFPSRTDGLQGAFERQSIGDHGAAILDAVDQGIALLLEQPRTDRHVILLVSQPQDAGSIVVPGDLVRRLGESNTSVYSVTFPKQDPVTEKQASCSSQVDDNLKPVPPLKLPTEILGRLCKDTADELAVLSGGQRLLLKNEGELKRTLLSLADDLSKSYFLSFQPSASDPGFHSVGVQVDKRLGRVVVSGRAAYWR